MQIRYLVFNNFYPLLFKKSNLCVCAARETADVPALAYHPVTRHIFKRISVQRISYRPCPQRRANSAGNTLVRYNFSPRNFFNRDVHFFLKYRNHFFRKSSATRSAFFICERVSLSCASEHGNHSYVSCSHDNFTVSLFASARNMATNFGIGFLSRHVK